VMSPRLSWRIIGQPPGRSTERQNRAQRLVLAAFLQQRPHPVEQDMERPNRAARYSRRRDLNFEV
jgi:hypothetical protein